MGEFKVGKPPQGRDRAVSIGMLRGAAHERSVQRIRDLGGRPNRNRAAEDIKCASKTFPCRREPGQVPAQETSQMGCRGMRATRIVNQQHPPRKQVQRASVILEVGRSGARDHAHRLEAFPGVKRIRIRGGDHVARFAVRHEREHRTEP